MTAHRVATHSHPSLRLRHRARAQLQTASFARLVGVLLLVASGCGDVEDLLAAGRPRAAVEGPPGAPLEQVGSADVREPPEGRLRDPLSEPALAAVRERAPDAAPESIDNPVWDYLWCWSGTDAWLCYGDESCLFLFGSICGPSDYAYCDGAWPDYYCVCQSSYYLCE